MKSTRQTGGFLLLQMIAEKGVLPFRRAGACSSRNSRIPNLLKVVRSRTVNPSQPYSCFFCFNEKAAGASPRPTMKNCPWLPPRGGCRAPRGWGRVRKEKGYKVVNLARRRLLPSRLCRATSLPDGGIPSPSRSARHLSQRARHHLLRTVPRGGLLSSSLNHCRAGACSRRKMRI